jgi:hypothetical protein
LLVAVAMSIVSLSPVRATSPLLHGSTAVSAGALAPCIDAYCTAFFTAGCPSAMAQPDAATTSIADVSRLNGQSLFFSWHDLSTTAYDAAAPSTGAQAPPVARVAFYVAFGCTAPNWFAFALTSDPLHRTTTYTIPKGASWLLVESLDISGQGSWSAS